MPKFKVGDIVSLKEGWSKEDWKIWPSIAPEMVNLSKRYSRKFTISRVREIPGFEPVYSFQEHNGWAWAERWIELSEPETPEEKQRKICAKVQQLWERQHFVKEVLNAQNK